MKYCCRIVILLCSICSHALAQDPDTLWTKTYGDWTSDEGFSVKETSDSGFIVVGQMHHGLYLMKTDPIGDTLWTRHFDQFIESIGYAVELTDDGGYIVAGAKSDSSFYDVYLVKTDAYGDTLWTKSYGNPYVHDCGYSVQQTSDSGFIVCGYIGEGGGGVDVWLLKTDSSGDSLWTRQFGLDSYDIGRYVRQTSDGGYIITGYTYILGRGTEVYLIKTSEYGDTIWTKTYGASGYEYGYCVQQIQNNGYIIVGVTDPFGAPDWDVYVIKTDSCGDILWTNTYGDIWSDAGYYIQQTDDLGYIITGYTAREGINSFLYIVKTDSSGNILWEKILADPPGHYCGNAIEQTVDGGYIVTGRNYGDIWLLRFGTESEIMEEFPESINDKCLNQTIFSGPLKLPEGWNWKIFDITGRQIHTVNPTPGVYFIEVKGEIKEKVIKIR